MKTAKYALGLDFGTNSVRALVVGVTNGTAYCTCNGEVLEATFKVPESGPIGLEGDRGEYRRIRLMRLR